MATSSRVGGHFPGGIYTKRLQLYISKLVILMVANLQPHVAVLPSQTNHEQSLIFDCLCIC